MMLEPNNTVLVLVDVQEKLTAVMHERERLVTNLEKLVKGMQILHIPILWIEQIPEKMGPTIAPLRALLEPDKPLSKSHFSCSGCTEFNSALLKCGRKQVLIAGIETHVCIYQTAIALIRDGYAVEVVADAMSSRNILDHQVGLEKICEGGRHSVGSGQGHITTVETALFELMRSANHAAFREILKIVR